MPQFETPLPPLPQTFAFRTRNPCRYEQPSQPPVETGLQSGDVPCPYAALCASTAGGLRPLTEAFGKRIKVTLAEPSSSIVVRSEHQYSKEERFRLSLRKHFYEINRDEAIPFELSAGAIEGMVAELRARGLQEPECELVREELIKLIGGATGDRRAFQSWADCRDTVRKAVQGIGLTARETDWVTADDGVLAIRARATLGCRRISEDDRFGKYLGFVDLRLNSTVSPIAMAVLVPPRLYRHDPHVYIVTGEYGPLYGAHAFEGTVYTTMDPDASGARCAQACIIMALAMLADRGACILGGYTLSFLGIVSEKLATPRPADCLYFERTGESNATPIGGMTLNEIANVLNQDDCNTSAEGVRVEREVDLGTVRGKTASGRRVRSGDHLAKRLIEAYVTARCPVILLVGTREWYPEIEHDTGHAVVIVGVRSGCAGDAQTPACGHPEPTELIVHDPGYMPYLKKPIDECLRASRCFEASKEWPGERQNPHYDKVHLIGVTPAKIRRQAYACIRELDNVALNPRTRFPETDSWLRCSTRIGSARTDTDFRIALLHRDDVFAAYFSPTKYPPQNPAAGPAILIDTEASIRSLRNGWYWCISCTSQDQLESLILFNASGRPAPLRGWDFSVVFRPAGYFLFLDPFREQADPPDHADCPDRTDTNSETAQEGTERATQEHRVTPLLEQSVLTSCSDRRLTDLISEIRSLGDVRLVDLNVLRDVDVRELDGAFTRRTPALEPASDNIIDRRTSTQIMSFDENLEPVRNWVVERFNLLNTQNARRGRRNVEIAALSTYFPEISGRWQKKLTLTRLDGSKVSKTRYELSMDALVNSICLAIDLKQLGRMENAIVQIVCGTVLDRCDCELCQKESKVRKAGSADAIDMIFETERSEKLRLLCDRLEQVRERVSRRRDGNDWYIALELEPGRTYLLNDAPTIGDLFNELSNPQFKQLNPHVGLNADIAHMIIAGVSSTALSQWEERILHAHTCDHPRMHTRDQPVGTWRPVDRYRSADYDYLRLLAGCARARGPRSKRTGEQMPFSGAVALELEGARGMAWIRDSLIAMRHQFDVVENFP